MHIICHMRMHATVWHGARLGDCGGGGGARGVGGVGAPGCGWGNNRSSMSRRKGPAAAKRKVTRWTAPVPLAMARSTSTRKSFAFCGW
eukprot:3635263-Prorocentrum_lima.AAC.1